MSPSVFVLQKSLPVAALFMAAAGDIGTHELAPLLNVGAIGAVLAWFLFKLEPRLRRVEEAMDRQSRIVALAVISMESVSRPVKHQAQEVLKELDRAEIGRKGDK